MKTSDFSRLRRLLLCAAGFAALTTSAFAHHSFGAIFDDKQELELHGVLTKVQWINPHSYYYVDVKNENGTTTTWAFESFPPAMMKRLGLTRDALTSQIGNKVKVLYNPAHDRAKPLGYSRVFEFEDGKRIIFTPEGVTGSE
ncbi:MAG: DUF6152 family protein [Steroidobacteraceae bacterium]